MTSSIRIHTSLAAATAALILGSVVVSTKWKQTSAQTAKERAVVLPMECLRAPEAPESFRALVEACLLSSAEATLKEHVNASEHNMEMLETAFSRTQLVESFLSGRDSWMSREQMEIALTASATWKRITGNPSFAVNKQYQAIAGMYRDSILKLTAKNAYFPAETREKILAKLDEADLSVEFGAFLLKRFDQMARKDVVEDISFADL